MRSFYKSNENAKLVVGTFGNSTDCFDSANFLLRGFGQNSLTWIFEKKFSI